MVGADGLDRRTPLLQKMYGTDIANKAVHSLIERFDVARRAGHLTAMSAGLAVNPAAGARIPKHEFYGD